MKFRFPVALRVYQMLRQLGVGSCSSGTLAPKLELARDPGCRWSSPVILLQLLIDFCALHRGMLRLLCGMCRRQCALQQGIHLLMAYGIRALIQQIQLGKLGLLLRLGFLRTWFLSPVLELLFEC